MTDEFKDIKLRIHMGEHHRHDIERLLREIERLQKARRKIFTMAESDHGSDDWGKVYTSGLQAAASQFDYRPKEL